ncbi:hypothetical protein Hte_002511 [Hypoxylon texense]
MVTPSLPSYNKVPSYHYVQSLEGRLHKMLGHQKQEQGSQKAGSMACTTRRPENRGRDGSQRSVKESTKDFGEAKKREEVNDGGGRPVNTSAKRNWKLALNESFAKFDAALRRLEACEKSDSDHQVNKRRAQAAAERDRDRMMI